MDLGYRAIPMLSNDWKIPLNMAIGIHVLILLGGLYLPGIFKAKPKFADIYTVSIVNVTEPAATPQAAPAPTAKETPAKTQESPPPVITPPKPAKAKSIVPIAEKVVQPAPSPAKSVSLKPLKKKKVTPVKKSDNEPTRQDLDQKRRQKLAQALREEQLLEERARLAREALESERQLLRSQQTAVPQPTIANAAPVDSSRFSTGSGGKSNANPGNSNLLESRFNASIANRLSELWVLPSYLQEDASLRAIVVITINSDGSIANMFFESKSGNRVFDQFVRKTIESADPLPPIPPALKKQRYEIGLVFTPGGIQ